MKLLVAPDSFKGSLSSSEAADAISVGFRRVFPDADCVLLPIADGGEGTAATLAAATGGSLTPYTVTGPLNQSVTASLALLGGGETAVIELAEAAGLSLVPTDKRDPNLTTTYGVGELLLAAVRHPTVRRIIVTLGGSATNDGGAGLLSALGVRFRDARGQELPRGGAALADLASVDVSGLLLDPAAVNLKIACDVDNPLTGPRGASAVFGPQKGATPDDVRRLDAALAHYADVLEASTGRRVSEVPGAGAAGGTAAGLLWLFPQAELVPGVELVLDALQFDTHLENADLVLTGEGRLDAQTLGGKAIAGVARRAKAAGVPVGAVVGGLTGEVTGEQLARELNLDAVIALPPYPCSLDEAVAHAPQWLADAAERAARWLRLGQAAR
ncbi:MAG: glycerate kinase [Armatimonadota bacterium]